MVAALGTEVASVAALNNGRERRGQKQGLTGCQLAQMTDELLTQEAGGQSTQSEDEVEAMGSQFRADVEHEGDEKNWMYYWRDTNHKHQ